MSVWRFVSTFVTLAGCMATTFPAAADDTARTPAAASPSTSLSTPAASLPSQAPAPLLERWLDLTNFSHSERYRNAFATGGWHVIDNGQQRSLVEGQFKFDQAAHYAIGFRASSGRYFNWGYGSYAGQSFLPRVLAQGFVTTYFTPAAAQEFGEAVQADPAGTATALAIRSNGWQFYMRELYFNATPIEGLTVQFGSFGIERGLASEITTFDDDGYLSGERVIVRKPAALFFDEVGYTNAYFGDIATPNLFDRGGSLKKNNYRQAFANKNLSSRIGFSGDYTWQTGTHTLREAAVIKTGESRAVDSVQFETYQRLNAVNLQGLNVDGGSGFAVTAKKQLGQHLNGDLGYADVDVNYSVYNDSRFFHAVNFSMNGDSYGVGKRPFAHVTWKLTPAVSLNSFYTHAIGSDVPNHNQQNYSAGLTFDLKALVDTRKAIF